MIFGLDRHFYAVELPQGAQIQIKNTVVTLSPGTYYAFSGAGPFASLYDHICARLAAVYGGTWSVAAHRPPGYALASGVRLQLAGGAGDEYIDFDGTDDVVKEVLGWPASTTGTEDFTDGALESWRAAAGSWCCWTAFDGRAASKDPIAERVTEWSSEHPEVAMPIVWRERRLRLWHYPLVYGVYALRNRAGQLALASQGGVATGDDHNCLERLWESAGRTLAPVVVAPDQTTLSLSLGATFEIYKLATRTAASQLSSLLARSPVAADLWEVRLPTVIVGGNYEL